MDTTSDRGNINLIAIWATLVMQRGLTSIFSRLTLFLGNPFRQLQIKNGHQMSWPLGPPPWLERGVGAVGVLVFVDIGIKNMLIH